MEDQPTSSTLRVTGAMVDRFAQVSGDASPLHVDEDYARQTPFGEPIAHGVLVLLLGLAAASTQPGTRLSRLRVRFIQPVLRDRLYTRHVERIDDRDAIARVLDGSRPVLEAKLEYAPGEPASAPSKRGKSHAVSQANVLRLDEMDALGPVGTEYRPDWTALAGLCDELGLRAAGVDVEHLAVLCWASYVAGMRVPGRSALVSGLDVTFTKSSARRVFTAEGQVAEVDARYKRVRVTGDITTGRTLAHVEVTTFVRRENEPPDASRVRELLDDLTEGSGLHGKVAFVTGGSRGLGAAVVQALAVAGCTVYAGFERSRVQAEQLVSALADDGDKVQLVQGDAADAEWCRTVKDEILEQQGRIDFVVLNAGPPVETFDSSGEFAERAANHVQRALALARAPLSAFADALADNGGTVVGVSSSYVSEPKQGLDHYVAAKQALEGVVRTAAVEHSGLRTLIVRPPRLATTFADSAVGDEDPLPVESVAAAIVRQLCHENDGLLEDFDTIDSAIAAAAESAKGVLAVAGTFTLDPILPVLEHWMGKLVLELAVEPAPFGQVFQELLDPGSIFGRNQQGVNVLFVRLQDWPADSEGIRTVDEFATAVRSCASRSKVPLLVAVAPSSTGSADRAALEERLMDGLADISGVHVVGSTEWICPYVIDHPFDAARDELAHIPYTGPAYAALGTRVARSVHSLLAPPFKVLVLDCDNTLWHGVCGEDGPQGIELRSSYKYLQDWAVRLHDRGVLICLASKNSDGDVDEVFRLRPEMSLRPQHIVARRVNWDNKADNLRSLAEELDLGLDSFVFIDDNPVEVAQVRAALPGVLALQLPTTESDIPGFLNRIWAFDKAAVTEEDRKRTESYRAGRDRQELRRSAITFSDFIAGLQLQIAVHEAEPEELPRVAQLTQRTNQFNLSAIRRTEPQLRSELDDRTRCWVIRVSDRFGDYGLVGAAITKEADDRVELDSFMMSCRVLGRGVEHAFLATLGREFAEARELQATYRPTPKNDPAHKFFDQVLGPGSESPDGAVVYRATMEAVANIAFKAEDADGDQPDGTSVKSVRGASSNHALRLSALTTIASDLGEIDALAEWVGTSRPTHGRLAEDDQTDPLGVVRAVLTGLLSVSAGSLRDDTTLESIKLSSLEIVDATVALEKHFGRLPRTLFFEHKTLGDLAAALPGPRAQTPRLESSPRRQIAVGVPEDADLDGVAVVGIAGRYPGSTDVPELWRNLLAGRDLVGDVSSRWGGVDAVDPAGGPGKTYTAAGGLIHGADEFDPLFFGIAPSEAETMDPQQRVLLQIAYHALEDAGHTAADLGPNVGVYVGAMSSDYVLFNAQAALTGEGRYPNADLYQLANRLSYFFDFTGPSIVVDTACSASGAALQLAFDAIRHGTVAAALVGGVNLILHPARRIQYAQLGMLSRTGRCQPFGAGADGMVTSEGIGCLLLRPVRDAVRDGDQIYGVIKAVGSNADGRTNGFMVPSPVAQARLISSTLRQAGVDPATVDYVEAHGTGTPLGDPIEIRGLTEAFGPKPAASVAIGSVKSNVGHLEAAAAVVGLTKVLLQLKHETLVPSLHAEELNAHIDFHRTPFAVQRERTPWPSLPGRPRRAGISSFGAGGVNVHMVVEEAPRSEADLPSTEAELILLSARSDDEVREICARLADELRRHDADISLADLAFTLRVGREAHPHRLSFMTSSREHLIDVLGRVASGEEPSAVHFGRNLRGGALADVFDGSSEMHEILAELTRRGRFDQLGRLWAEGAAIDWLNLLGRDNRRRVSLPGYPFRKTRFPLGTISAPTAEIVKAPDVTFYRPTWRSESRPPRSVRASQSVVVLGDGAGNWAGSAVPVVDVSGLDQLGQHSGELVVVDRRGLDRQEDQFTPWLLDTAMKLGRMAVLGQRVTYAHLTRPHAQVPASAAVAGFARALRHETTQFQAVRIEVAGPDLPSLDDVLAELGTAEEEVRFAAGDRQVRRWQVMESSSNEPTFRPGGRYLITGGGGGVGRVIAVHLAKKYGASVALLGRSAPPADLDDLVDDVLPHGGVIRYLQADVTDEDAVMTAVAEVRTAFGPLHGVIHAAAITDDRLFKDKSPAAVHSVFAAKATGATLLDRATATDRLDFFVLMSSIIGVLGNAGQTDYAAANRFLDAFAEWRSAQVEKGARHGRSLSVVWPIWENGGMKMPESTRTLFATTLGQRPIGDRSALQALETIVSLDVPTVLVGCGDQLRISQTLNPAPVKSPTNSHKAVSAVAIADKLRDVAAKLINTVPTDIDPAADFGDYGFNSLLFTDFANRLNERFGLTLSPVVFFETPTIEALAAHLQRSHREAFAADMSDDVDSRPEEQVLPDRPTVRQPAVVAEPRQQAAQSIAVIGMSGRLPGSPDLDAFWENLLHQRCLTGDNAPRRATLNGWKGGFIEDVTAFDAAFFGISPREARLMDPQQRLFLETAWAAIEDAGYDPRSLAGTATGVFAAVTLHDYSEMLKASGEAVAGHTITGHVHGVIANRLSYLLDLAGPSEVVDTACSSSLTALHRAVVALQTGECDGAIVGGVNVLLTPDWFDSLNKAGVLSTTGRCWAFDGRADGFVRSEGVGVVVLKPLDDALRDGDTVRGVIRGTAVNHGGRAHSLTAPNPAGQAAVIVTAMERAGVDPRTVSYVETHGTGTKLGDPIEVAGLRTAFEQLGATGTESWCRLGAVKANVGHLESAAGMAGLLKVLLAFRHGVLPANVTGHVPNPHLDLSNSPFSLLDETVEWRHVDIDGHTGPRRAGVSAFGFGGANAHVVLEQPSVQQVAEPVDGTPELVVLSAATHERLVEYARRLSASAVRSEHSLADLAYTSRVGRTALAERMAVIAETKEQLVECLTAYIDGRSAKGLYASGSESRDDHVRPSSHDLDRLAHRWVAGTDIEWPEDSLRRRVPFPTYPFDHATSHGPLLSPVDEASSVPQAGPEASMPQLYTRVWEPAPVSAQNTVRDRPRCLLIVGRESCLPLLEALPGRPEFHWIVLREPMALPAIASDEYEVDFGDYHAGREVAQQVLKNHGPIEFLVDLADVATDRFKDREGARVGVLQVIASQGRSGGLRYVHATRNVAAVHNTDVNLVGARLAGLARAVGAEYAAIRAVSVDLDSTAHDAQAQLATAIHELAASDDEQEVAYRGGLRYAPRVRPVTGEHTPHPRRLGGFDVDSRRAYLVTGGTGGLGLAAAQLLVNRGARRIALTGTRPLPPRDQWNSVSDGAWWAERVAAIRRMEAAGAEVSLYFGRLTDEDLAGFIGSIGPVAGVLHCAGLVSPTPAFLHKTFDEIERCWEPKGEGLTWLHAALAGQEPDFVVLYSSLSAAIPSLSTGLTDYASANAVLDVFAAHHQGRSRTKYLAIDWGSWTGLGMGAVTSPRYRELGLAALTQEQGLSLLDAALAHDGPASLIAVNGTLGQPAAVAQPHEAVAAPVPVQEDVQARFIDQLRATFAEALMMDIAAVQSGSRFVDLGVDSILIAAVVPRLESMVGVPMEPSVILEHPSVERLATYLFDKHRDGIERWSRTSEAPIAIPVAHTTERETTETSPTVLPIAIIGMSGRFPGAENTDAFWELLRTGRSGVSEVPRSRWDVASLYSPVHREGMSVSKWGGFLTGIEDFDPDHFGIPVADAAHMDPLIRLFLECADTTFADAGYSKEDLAGRRIGVFTGSGTSNYGVRIQIPGRATATGLNQNFIAAQVAQVFDLRGPNLVVDTACSSSLSGLYLARQALLLEECEMALVGGADLLLDETPYLSLSAAKALSPDGVCHVFDANANGLVPGEGVGAVLLKRLDRALADGDRILAVIESVAMNNDGRTMGLTTPNPDAQQEVVLDALAKADVDASTVSYVEAHGTGTMIGDPIELRALTQVFERFTTERGFCAVGSVKSNVGHLLMAAGMASLQKVVLSLTHQVLPPTLHCAQPNPRFAFDASPFYPNVELREWKPRHGIRRAGVSAFGFGGTNCHAVVRELTAEEHSHHVVRREPLPEPVYRRQCHWVDRERPIAPAPRLMLELEELT